MTETAAATAGPPDGSPPLRIDVIIPTYGRGNEALNVAAAVLPQLDSGDTVTVVWQGSGPPRGETPPVRLVRSDPPGLPRARNAGRAAARGGIVLFLDDDVVPLAGLLAGHRDGYRDPSVGAVAGYVDDPLMARHSPAPSVFEEATGRLVQNFTAPASCETVSVMGANMSFRRTALEAAGGFDERFSGNAHYEDVDAAFRVRRDGWRILYRADARVRHLRLVSGGCRKDGGGRFIYHQFANTAYFACRHMPRAHLRSWARYWWYRLEFVTRTAAGNLRHDPLLVAAGVLGAAAGLSRWCLWSRRYCRFSAPAPENVGRVATGGESKP